MSKDSKKFDTTQQAVALGGFWNLITQAEGKMLKIAEKHMGREAFIANAGPFIEASVTAHNGVDALKAKFLQIADSPVEDRKAYMAEYIETMPRHLDTLYHATCAASRALRDVIPKDKKLHKEAVKVVKDLEKLQPEEAVAYNKAERAARKGR